MSQMGLLERGGEGRRGCAARGPGPDPAWSLEPRRGSKGGRAVTLSVQSSLAPPTLRQPVGVDLIMSSGI